MLVRSTWARHVRSREGAGKGDGGVGTSRTVVRFILGQPRKDWERRVKLEMESKSRPQPLHSSAALDIFHSIPGHGDFANHGEDE